MQTLYISLIIPSNRKDIFIKILILILYLDNLSQRGKSEAYLIYKKLLEDSQTIKCRYQLDSQ